MDKDYTLVEDTCQDCGYHAGNDDDSCPFCGGFITHWDEIEGQ